MKPLDEAIQHMEHEIERYAPSKPGSAYWLVRQASAAGLSFLTKAQQLGLEDAEGIDKFRKRVRTEVVGLKEEDTARESSISVAAGT